MNFGTVTKILIVAALGILVAKAAVASIVFIYLT